MQIGQWIFGLGALAVAGLIAAGPAASHAEAGERIFELRTYTAVPGKLEALQTRFREHTVTLFEKHGMTNVGYWVPSDPPRSEDTLIYLLAHETREAAAASWEAFRNDPAWRAAREASEVDGRLVVAVESVYLSPTDFSASR